MAIGLMSLFFVASCNKTSPDHSVVFGKIVTAADVDANNSPTAVVDVFSPQQKTIYVVAEGKNIAAGTKLSANWAREGTVLQVSNEVTAQTGYHDSNIEFHMSPGVDGWMPGHYTVQLIINGQGGPKVGFTIKELPQQK